MNCKFKFHLRAALHRGAGRPAVPVGSAGLVEALPGRWAPPAGGMRFTVLRIPRVRARKPNSLALRANGREPGPAGGLLFPDFQVHGSRSKTEFFGFAGRRARTAPACELLFSDFQVHGSRSKTEFFGFAGRRARTAPAGGLLLSDF